MEGKTALRDEIIGKLNSLFSEDVITNNFFTEFVVQ
jgi:flagellar basal body-associated protein FliL